MWRTGSKAGTAGGAAGGGASVVRRKEKPRYKVFLLPRPRMKQMIAVNEHYRPTEGLPRSAVLSV